MPLTIPVRTLQRLQSNARSFKRIAEDGKCGYNAILLQTDLPNLSAVTEMILKVHAEQLKLPQEKRLHYARQACISSTEKNLEDHIESVARFHESGKMDGTKNGWFDIFKEGYAVAHALNRPVVSVGKEVTYVLTAVAEEHSVEGRHYRGPQRYELKIPSEAIAVYYNGIDHFDALPFTRP